MNVESRTELDSHANMPVVGKHAYIIVETGKKVDVSPFTHDYRPLMVPLVDTTVWYGMTTHITGNHTYWYYGMHSMSHQ